MGKDSTTDTYETIKAMYYSGRVKPSYNKIVKELESDPKNINLILLACQCLVRIKDYNTLLTFAESVIKLEPNNADAYYYKGLACQYTKGQEQESLKNFNEALVLTPDNPRYLQSKGTTHFLLYTDYHLPVKFAEKHRVKAEESFLKVVEVVEAMEEPTYVDYLTLADVCMTISRTIDAKRHYIKAVNAYEAADESDQDKNIYKDIVKAHKACVKQAEKFTED